ncbi:VOC family protein [Kutzneria sp. NPDC052558]|uniref:VOC family protein n=1 Tax=Kutzneria sp. NPDC052558 TaxID=3364121 RepID=UPI0037C952C5
MIPTVKGVDHFAYTVADLDRAIDLFTTVFGAQILYRQGPVQDADGDFMRRQLDVHPRATCYVSMLRLGNANLELFSYTAPGQRKVAPEPRSTGGHELAFAVDDVPAAVDWLGGRLEVVSAQADVCSLRTDWGMWLRLVQTTPVGPRIGDLPGLTGVAGAAYTVADLDVAVRFLTGTVGAQLIERSAGGRGEPERATVQLGPTPTIELRASGAVTGTRPRNSDVGGHHLAFAVDDVVAASACLGAAPGARLLGDPQVIAEGGPIDGVRWQYFTGPDGFQFELAFAPPGLPYERSTTARRFEVVSLRH